MACHTGGVGGGILMWHKACPEPRRRACAESGRGGAFAPGLGPMATAELRTELWSFLRGILAGRRARPEVAPGRNSDEASEDRLGTRPRSPVLRPLEVFA